MRRFLAGCCAWFMLGGLSLAEDAPPLSVTAQSISWEVVIAEATDAAPPRGGEGPSAAAILEMETAGKLAYLARHRLTGLENQQATLKCTELAPVVSGWTIATVGRTFASYRSMSVGTELTVVSRVQSDGTIVTDLKLQRSALSPSDPPADPSGKLQSVVVLDVAATVQGKPKEPLIVTGRQVQKGTQPGQTWVLLTAATNSIAAARPARAAFAPAPINPVVAPTQQELRAFYLKSPAAKQTAVLLQQFYAPALRLQRSPMAPAHPHRGAAGAVLTTLETRPETKFLTPALVP